MKALLARLAMAALTDLHGQSILILATGTMLLGSAGD